MSDRQERQSFFKDRFHLILISILVLNTILVALGLLFVLQPDTREDSTIAYQQDLANNLASFNQRLASEYNVLDVPEVREALFDYNYEVGLATTSDELIRVIFDQGRRVQETIFKEADLRLQEETLSIINTDANVRDITDKTRLFIRIENNEAGFYPEQLLEPITRQQVKELLSPDYHLGPQRIDIEIEQGRGKLVVPETVDEQMRALTEDLNSLRLRLHEVRVQAGLAEMVGPGITLKVYDAVDSADSPALVHDADIRDIVNELFSAGAQGVSVGNQRLTLTSAIRCSGPLIMVNYQQIPTNPVTIQAVGEPDLLISGLDVIKREMEMKRGLHFDINHSGFIKLPGYSIEE